MEKIESVPEPLHVCGTEEIPFIWISYSITSHMKNPLVDEYTYLSTNLAVIWVGQLGLDLPYPMQACANIDASMVLRT